MTLMYLRILKLLSLTIVITLSLLFNSTSLAKAQCLSGNPQRAFLDDSTLPPPQGFTCNTVPQTVSIQTGPVPVTVTVSGGFNYGSVGYTSFSGNPPCPTPFTPSITVLISPPVPKATVGVTNFGIYGSTITVSDNEGQSSTTNSSYCFTGSSISQITITSSTISGIWYFSLGEVNVYPAAQPLSTFENFVRYPAEEQMFIPMANNIAYYRDIYVGAKTMVTGAKDGDNLSTTFTFPDFTTLTQTAVFHSLYNGQQNCFVFSDARSPQCGSTSGELLWPLQYQCGRTGLVSMDFYSQAAGSTSPTKFFSGQFTVDKRIAPDKVPYFPQKTSPWSGDHYGQPGVAPSDSTISLDGCTLSSCAELVNYHVFHGSNTDQLNPRTLNNWLRANHGYQGLDVVWAKVAQYANTVYGVKLKYLKGRRFVPQDICSMGPQLIRLDSQARIRPHWVAVMGDDGTKAGDYRVCDPGTRLGFEELLSVTYPYPDRAVVDSRVFVGPEIQATAAGITVKLHSPAELLITDPQGRRTGLDPLTGKSYEEIPISRYVLTGTDRHIDDEPGGIPVSEVKDLEVGEPIAGLYQVTVTGNGTGTYQLFIEPSDIEGNGPYFQLDNVPVFPGAVHHFSIGYSSAVGANLEIMGGFDGGGQRPKDVNKFLTYASVTSDTTSVPNGTKVFPLIIVYNNSVIPASFQATLNGVSIASSFNPVPGGAQAVSLPLQPGRNVLDLSIDGKVTDGNNSNHIATDKDRLVFDVQ